MGVTHDTSSSRSHRDHCQEWVPDLADGESFTDPRPNSQRSWVDSDGVMWRRRGAHLLESKAARKLLDRPEVIVMHVYAGEVHEHRDRSRAELVDALESYWAGAAEPNTHFSVGEFRSEKRQVMVMIEEGC
jgi:hypothetical protein